MAPPKNKKKRSSVIDLELDSDSECELIPKTSSSPRTVDTWPRFIVIHSKREKKSASRINPFLVGETLRGVVGRPEATRLRSGDLLVQCQKKSHATALLKLCKIGDYDVETSPHKTLNSCKGVVRNDALAEMEEGEIISHLKSQGVTGVKHVSAKRGGRDVKLSTLVLTFGVPKLPERLWVGFCWARVTPFIPLPLRCFQCQRYGHGRSACKNTSVCVRCGQKDHGSDTCTREPRCANCSGNHPSSSKDCPVWKEESEIQKVRVERGISFREARTLVTSQTCPQGRSYAEVAAAAPTRITKQTVDCGSQTTAVCEFSTKPSGQTATVETLPTLGAGSDLRVTGTSGSLAMGARQGPQRTHPTNTTQDPTPGARLDLKVSSTHLSFPKGVGQGSKTIRSSLKGNVSSTPTPPPKSPTKPSTSKPPDQKHSIPPKQTGPKKKN